MTLEHHGLVQFSTNFYAKCNEQGICNRLLAYVSMQPFLPQPFVRGSEEACTVNGQGFRHHKRKCNIIEALRLALQGHIHQAAAEIASQYQLLVGLRSLCYGWLVRSRSKELSAA